MESIITSPQEDAPHLNALLKRFTLWGMLNYYDMDRVFHAVETPCFRFFFVFYSDTMDHRAFVQYLRELHEYEADPLRGLARISFFYPHNHRLHDFNSLDAVLRTQLTP